MLNAGPGVAERRRLVASAGWNLLGAAAPGLAAVAAIPLLLARIGLPRFGLLALIWSLLAYGSLCDFGMSSALSKFTAEWLAGFDPVRLRDMLAGGVVALAGLGTLVAIGFAGLAPWVPGLFHLTGPLAGEATQAIYVLAAGMPAILMSGALRGTLEGLRRFDLSNSVRIPVGVLGYVAPLGASLLSPTLAVVVLGAVLARAAGLVGYGCVLWRHWPTTQPGEPARRSVAWHLVRLLRYSGWLALANSVYQLAFSIDRIFIGLLCPIAELAFFAAPAEIVTRLLLIPNAVGGVLLPTFAARNQSPLEHRKGLLNSASAAAYTLMLPVCVGLASLAVPGLDLWLGAGLGAHAAPVLRWLAVGLFFEAMASVPRSAIAAVRPRAIAMLCLAEIVPYLLVLYQATARFGIIGAAIAWTLLMVVNYVGLLAMARPLGLVRRPDSALQGSAALLGLTALVVTATVAHGAAAVGAAVGGAALCWAAVLRLTPPLRRLVQEWGAILG